MMMAAALAAGIRSTRGLSPMGFDVLGGGEIVFGCSWLLMSNHRFSHFVFSINFNYPVHHQFVQPQRFQKISDEV